MLHEICSDIVSVTSEYPEITVFFWMLSLTLTLLQVGLLVKNRLYPKPTNVLEIPVPVTVPYVPDEHVVKLVRLLNNQEEGWDYSSTKLGNFFPDREILKYGNVQIALENDEIQIFHNSIEVDLAKKSKAPDLDFVLIKEALANRLKKVKRKIMLKEAMAVKEAEDEASREFLQFINTI